MANIKVKDLTDTQTINTDDEIMVLTNENSNLVQNITVENFITNVISSDSDNVIEQGADGKLFVETPANITGNLSNLTTTNKSTLVGAINEVDGDVGNLANLTTSVKTNVVNAINSEVSARNTAETNIQNDYNGKIGTLSNLDTTDKSNIVGAINELAAIAEPSLQYETMNNSKALETGAPSENAIILADVQKYAHSTFDRNKFTVVGSPIITDDGIASGFSNAKAVTTNGFKVLNLLNHSWSILSPIISGVTSTDYGCRPVLIAQYGYSSDGTLAFTGTNKTVSFTINTPDDTTPETRTNHRISINKVLNTIPSQLQIRGDFNYQTGEYSLYYNLFDGNGWQFGGSAIPTTTNKQLYDIVYNNDREIYFNRRDNNNANDNVLDLKYTSITVDGVPVFSGNKTGIDTVKADDYTVVPSGTSTVSVTDDGIASGFSGTTNGINTGLTSQSSDNIILECMLTTKTVATGQIYVNGDVNNYFQLGHGGSDRKWNIRLGDGTQWLVDWSGTSNPLPTITDNTKYIVKIVITSSKFDFYLNGTLIETETLTSFSGDISHLFACIGYRTYGTALPCLGSIDLNAFKIYVDGNLVYQPCLRIPYTESFTGSKIVDVIYRDRVVDAYEQGYPQRFYTLSDTDFTLPMGEIYGDIEYNRANKLDLTTANATQETVSKINGWCIPDYANGVGKVVNTVYQAAKNVYVKIVNNTDGGAAGYIYIGTTNNPTTEIAVWGGNVATAQTVYYMIPKGYYYKASGTGITSVTEFPFMGE